MKRALVALIAGTVLSGLAAAYASTIPRQARDAAPIKAEAEASKLAAN
jgi:hypothetical protein